MLWYLLKTWIGREEDLIKEVRRTVPPYLYGECFVIYQERIWRRQQKNIVHVEPLFPGCVFITCKKTEPLFRRLELVPAMSRLMAGGYLTILPLMKEDIDFLEKLSGGDHMVRLSYVRKNEQGRIDRVEGPLRDCQEEVEYYQFKKRYAVVRHRLWGEEQGIVLGILLGEDVGQRLMYGDLEVSMRDPIEAMG